MTKYGALWVCVTVVAVAAIGCSDGDAAGLCSGRSSRHCASTSNNVTNQNHYSFRFQTCTNDIWTPCQVLPWGEQALRRSRQPYRAIPVRGTSISASAYNTILASTTDNKFVNDDPLWMVAGPTGAEHGGPLSLSINGQSLPYNDTFNWGNTPVSDRAQQWGFVMMGHRYPNSDHWPGLLALDHRVLRLIPLRTYKNTMGAVLELLAIDSKQTLGQQPRIIAADVYLVEPVPGHGSRDLVFITQMSHPDFEAAAQLTMVVDASAALTVQVSLAIYPRKEIAKADLRFFSQSGLVSAAGSDHAAAGTYLADFDAVIHGQPTVELRQALTNPAKGSSISKTLSGPLGGVGLSSTARQCASSNQSDTNNSECYWSRPQIEVLPHQDNTMVWLLNVAHHDPKTSGTVLNAKLSGRLTGSGTLKPVTSADNGHLYRATITVDAPLTASVECGTKCL